MSDLTEFTYAQLSLAAYADLSGETLYTDALVAAGFSPEQAEQFAATYRVFGREKVSGTIVSGSGMN